MRARSGPTRGLVTGSLLLHNERSRQHAFLTGMIAPAALFLVDLIATEFCARALFNTMT